MRGFSTKQITIKRLFPFGSLAIVLAVLIAGSYERAPRAWEISKIPIAFWAWQTEAPSKSFIVEAVRESGAQILFLRAGQIDFEDGKLRRIRSVKGAFPSGIETHLLYNATRSFLSSFERLKPDAIASTILNAYREDMARAKSDGAQVVGLQLDIDSPTRLLPHYEQVLRYIRSQMPYGHKLSITGLPTWMNSPALEQTLAPVDFWIPQFYGAKIPDRMDVAIPIASSEEISRAIERARKLNRPFYAGLAAYGYAILYARSGSLLSLRGDLDPALVVRDSNFELLERKPFPTARKPKDGNSEPITSEWRYIYRARRESVIAGMPVRAGEYLMFDVPSAASLRENARIIRQRAGDMLLGLCIFRLPVGRDSTTLTVREMAAALSDRDPLFTVNAQAEALQKGKDRYYLSLRITNSGSARALMGEGALSVTLSVPTASVRAVRLGGLSSSESLCAALAESGSEDFAGAHPCGLMRANALRLKALTWEPGASAEATIEIGAAPPATLSIEISLTADDGRELRIEKKVRVERRLIDEL